MTENMLSGLLAQKLVLSKCKHCQTETLCDVSVPDMFISIKRYTTGYMERQFCLTLCPLKNPCLSILVCFYKPLMSRGLFCLTNLQWKFDDSWKIFLLSSSVLSLRHLKSNFSVMFEILKANGKKEAI